MANANQILITGIISKNELAILLFLEIVRIELQLVFLNVCFELLMLLLFLISLEQFFGLD